MVPELFIVYAHEEGGEVEVSSWLGPLIFFLIIVIAVLVVKFLKRR